jgi:hypothetical protein
MAADGYQRRMEGEQRHLPRQVCKKEQCKAGQAGNEHLPYHRRQQPVRQLITGRKGTGLPRKCLGMKRNLKARAEWTLDTNRQARVRRAYCSIHVRRTT